MIQIRGCQKRKDHVNRTLCKALLCRIINMFVDPAVCCKPQNADLNSVFLSAGAVTSQHCLIKEFYDACFSCPILKTELIMCYKTTKAICANTCKNKEWMLTHWLLKYFMYFSSAWIAWAHRSNGIWKEQFSKYIFTYSGKKVRSTWQCRGVDGGCQDVAMQLLGCSWWSLTGPSQRD